jgi:TATA-box binding protein (TBP) (component of TFIID and TFIIIB)
MKVVVENMIASCKLSGDVDLEKLSQTLEGAKYQPTMFEGIMLTIDDPKADVFIMGDGTIKLHGLTSEEKLKNALGSVLSLFKKNQLELKVAEHLKIIEVIASYSVGSRIDPKEVYEEFKNDGVIYDPSELPGFILRVGNAGIEVLIFPEGKVVSRGADNILDAVSSLQMVEARINKGQ